MNHSDAFVNSIAEHPWRFSLMLMALGLSIILYAESRIDRSAEDARVLCEAKHGAYLKVEKVCLYNVRKI